MNDPLLGPIRLVSIFMLVIFAWLIRSGGEGVKTKRFQVGPKKWSEIELRVNVAALLGVALIVIGVFFSLFTLPYLLAFLMGSSTRSLGQSFENELLP